MTRLDRHAGMKTTTSVPAEGYGDLVIYRDELGRIEIAKADPRIRLDVRMVAGIRDLKPRGAVCTEDGVLTLTDDHGHRYIYRVDFDGYDPATESFPAEWPD